MKRWNGRFHFPQVEKWENWGPSPTPRLFLMDALLRWKVPTQVQGLLLVIHDPRPRNKLAFYGQKNRVSPPHMRMRGCVYGRCISCFGSHPPTKLLLGKKKAKLKWLNHKNAPFPKSHISSSIPWVSSHGDLIPRFRTASWKRWVDLSAPHLDRICQEVGEERHTGV